MNSNSASERHPAAASRSMETKPWVGGLLIGAPSLLLFLGSADLAARLTNASTALLVSVSQVVIKLTPPDLVAFAIKNLGTNDKPVLFLSIILTALLLAAVCGWLELRQRWNGLVLFAAAQAATVFVVVTAAGTNLAGIISALIGAVVGLGAFVLLTRLVRRMGRGGGNGTPGGIGGGGASERARESGSGRIGSGDVNSEPDSPACQTFTGEHSRRVALRAAGLLTLAGAGALAFGRSVAVLGGTAAGAIARLVLPKPADPAPPIPAAAQVSVPGTPTFITPATEFYRIDTALTPPTVDPDSWSLRIHGMVQNEVTLTMDELLGLPLVERTLTMTCVSNPVGGDLVGNAQWLGYPLAELLKRAVPNGDADMVLSKSIDGFTASTPIDAMTDGRDALIVVGMNGEQLLPEHGFPARLIVPGLYGFVSATKWVTELEVTRFDRAQAYWTERGWDSHGPILPSSRIDVPAPLAGVSGSPLVVAGTAWAQHDGIKQVQVRLDDGAWESADLASAVSRDTWRQWRHEFANVSSGLHSVTTRAITTQGTVQTEERRDSIPNSATGHHRIQFTVS